MAVDLTSDPGGLFRRLGRIGKLILIVAEHQGALPAAFEGLLLQYDGTTPPGLRGVAAPLPGLVEPILRRPASWLGPVLGPMARDTLLEMVKADNRGAGATVADALRYVIRQMVADGDSLQDAIVSTAATAFPAGNVGDGVLVSSALTGEGYPEELILPEQLVVTCTASSYAGTATSGRERFRALGGTPAADRLGYDWPNGSGADVSLLAVYPDAADDVLTGSGFETFTTANTPDNWAIVTGSAGTEVLKEDTTVYSGSHAVKVVGSATLTEISQTFGSAAGTTAVLASLTPYAFSMRYRLSGVPAAGVLKVQLTDAGGTVLTDVAGNSNELSVTLSAASAGSWLTLSGVFRIRNGLVPGAYRLRVKLTTALSVGTDLFLDHLCLARMVRLYEGGPYLRHLAGVTPFAVGDGHTLDVANDRGGASDNATFHALADRLFGLRELGIRFPTSATPTIDDSLIQV